MKISIRQRFLFSYIVLFLFCFLILNTFGQKRIYHYLEEQEQTELYEQAVKIAQEKIPDIRELSRDKKNMEALKEFFSAYSRLTGKRVWLADVTGQILLDSNLKQSFAGQNINQHDSSFLSNQSITGQYPAGMMKERVAAVIYPVTDTFDTSGYIIMMSPEQELVQHSFRYVDILHICMFIVFGLFAVLLLYLYYKAVRPARAIARATLQYADGRFDVALPQKTLKEYTELVSAIEYLVQRINGLTDYQKKFIANVSHDFRSPLTSIKGYAEALSDGVIPYDMRKKYFEIIFFEVERLQKLTENLLELNEMEQDGILLERTTFDINGTIRRCTAPFEQRCSKKKISLNLNFSSKEQFVYADLDKIQQVLQNLLDNAVKFSPADSSVDILVSKQKNKVFVSIRDHGIGIPKESINKIWERFYKTDLSRGKDQTGTGLGLSIVREILDAHGENINVISTEGIGTEFIFSLPEGKINEN